MNPTVSIDPKDVIRKMSVEDLCDTADGYFRRIADPTSLLSKPFASLVEGPELLYRLGLLLSGLQLSRGLRVLDFASGTCWLSRILNQFGCATISLDVSAHALEIGRQLFAMQPVLGGSIAPPAFIRFDGHHIDLPDSSVDRIACFAAFHHVPNQKETLSEMYRVLKEGGIAGFSEPGRNHSQDPPSQYEMLNYGVLENDIVIEDILQLAGESGFTGAYLKPLIEPNAIVTPEEYDRILKERVLPERLAASSLDAMASGTVFFLVKGKLQLDSRGHTGLQYRIALPRTEFRVALNSTFILEVSVVNTGEARWLAKTPNMLGAVSVGIHLYTARRELIDLDFHRWNFPEDTGSGKEVFARIEVPSPAERGDYLLCVDLVSDGVCWFENIGSQPAFVRLTVD